MLNAIVQTKETSTLQSFMLWGEAIKHISSLCFDCWGSSQTWRINEIQPCLPQYLAM